MVGERLKRMASKIVAMVHVPDVRATAQWYQGIGFALAGFNEDCGEMNWALLTFGGGELMLNTEGRPSDAWRREVDLYIYVDDVDALYERLKGRVELVDKPPYDTFYGMRELIIRDCNRFWITFGQPSPRPPDTDAG